MFGHKKQQKLQNSTNSITGCCYLLQTKAELKNDRDTVDTEAYTNCVLVVKAHRVWTVKLTLYRYKS